MGREIKKVGEWWKWGEIKVDPKAALEGIEGRREAPGEDDLVVAAFEFIMDVVGDEPLQCEMHDGSLLVVADCESEKYDVLVVIDKYGGKVVKAWWKEKVIRLEHLLYLRNHFLHT